MLSVFLQLTSLKTSMIQFWECEAIGPFQREKMALEVYFTVPWTLIGKISSCAIAVLNEKLFTVQSFTPRPPRQTEAREVKQQIRD